MTRFLLSCVPVAVLVAALTGLRLPAWKAALAAFAVCVAEALAMRAAPARDVAATIGCEMPNVFGGIAAMAALAFMGDRSRNDLRRQAWAWTPFALVVAALRGA